MSAEETDDFRNSLRPARPEDIEAELRRMSRPVPEPDASAIRYISLLLWSLATRGPEEAVLRRSQPLPAAEMPEAKLDRMPTFDQVIARLKMMCGLSGDRSPLPVEGVIKVQIMKRDHTFSVRIQDADVDSFCRIAVKEEDS